MPRFLEWSEDSIPVLEVGDIGHAVAHLDLTALYGEREFTRNAAFVEVQGEPAIVTRTMNRNQVRAIRIADGHTLWVSPDLFPPPETVQISDMALGDMDGDGHVEALLASYEGDVILIDTTDGSLKWHRRLDYLIVNPMLQFAKITNTEGLQLALTVGHDAPRIYGNRINGMHNPSLLVLNCRGEVEWVVPEYDDFNSDGHMTWVADINGDGYAEVCCCGHDRIHWYDGQGSYLYTLPTPGEDGHPDALIVCDWDHDGAGKEIIYLDGTTGVRIYTGEGDLVSAVDLTEYSTHLQQILVYPSEPLPKLVAANIRSPDAHLLMLNHDLSVEWALHTNPNALGLRLMDWTGDGMPEIVAGSFGRQRSNERSKAEVTLSVMTAEGSPVYQARWPNRGLCSLLDTRVVDGHPEVLSLVGSKDGPEGRFSLAEGSHNELYILRP